MTDPRPPIPLEHVPRPTSVVLGGELTFHVHVHHQGPPDHQIPPELVVALGLLRTLTQKMETLMALTVEQQLAVITRLDTVAKSIAAAFDPGGLVATIVAKALKDAGVGDTQVATALENVQPDLDAAEKAITTTPAPQA